MCDRVRKQGCHRIRSQSFPRCYVRRWCRRGELADPLWQLRSYALRCCGCRASLYVLLVVLKDGDCELGHVARCHRVQGRHERSPRRLADESTHQEREPVTEASIFSSLLRCCCCSSSRRRRPSRRRRSTPGGRAYRRPIPVAAAALETDARSARRRRHRRAQRKTARVTSRRREYHRVKCAHAPRAYAYADENGWAGGFSRFLRCSAEPSTPEPYGWVASGSTCWRWLSGGGKERAVSRCLRDLVDYQRC